MKNTLKRIAYVFIILLFLLLLVIKVYAVTEEDLKLKQSEIEEQINNTNTEIIGIQNKMSSTLNQINKLNVQIKECEDELENEKDNLENLNNELLEKKEELLEAQKEYSNQKKVLDTRLVAIYESSKTTYLDLLIGAKDLSDFISKYYMLEQIAEYDNVVLKDLKIAKDVVQTKTENVEIKADETERIIDTLKNKNQAKEILIRDKNNLISTLSEEEIELNYQLEQFEQDKKQIEKELVELAKKNAIKASITPSKSRIYITTFR